MNNTRSKQRLNIASSLLWKRHDIPYKNILSTLNWLSGPLREYYKDLVDWVEEYENA